MAEGDIEALKRLDISDFDWNAINPRSGGTVLFDCLNAGLADHKVAERLSTMEWLIKSGANPSQAIKQEKVDPRWLSLFLSCRSEDRGHSLETSYCGQPKKRQRNVRLGNEERYVYNLYNLIKHLIIQ